MPDELVEKIFTYANNQRAQEIINQINDILIKNDIQYVFKDSSRQFNNSAFRDISEIIAASPIYCYTRIALFIALSNELSTYEKMHFFSLMIINKQLTQNQKTIFDFLASRAKEFRPRIQHEERINFTATTPQDFMLSALGINDLNKMELLIKFLFKNGIGLPPQTLGHLIEKEDKNLIPLVRWTLNHAVEHNGLGDMHGTIPLEYCLGKKKCWLDEKWTKGTTGHEYFIVIGKMGFQGYSKENALSDEDIAKKVEYYEEVINLLKGHMANGSHKEEIEKASD